jgi:hypothetical protein
MNSGRSTSCMILVLVLLGAAAGTVIRVPEDYDEIQLAINAASNGDVVSVWGPVNPGDPPPYV